MTDEHPPKETLDTICIPFSTRSLAKGLKISQGFHYDERELNIHGNERPHHLGIDFQAPAGTPILAAADGFAKATYHLDYTLDNSGQRIGFGLGFTVYQLIVHDGQPLARDGEGYYLVYSHLAKPHDSIPYVAPTGKSNDIGETVYPLPTAIACDLATFISEAARVKTGDTIGYVGCSGLPPSNALIVPPQTAGELALLSHDYQDPTWDPAGSHLDFRFHRRTADGTRPIVASAIDPFGIYGTASDYLAAFASDKKWFGPRPFRRTRMRQFLFASQD